MARNGRQRAVTRFTVIIRGKADDPVITTTGIWLGGA
jgi:hypothetical protein